MKALIKNAGDVVVYLSEEATLDENGYKAEGVTFRHANTEDYRLVDVTSPEPLLTFISNQLSYDGSWAVINDEEYDDALEAYLAPLKQAKRDVVSFLAKEHIDGGFSFGQLHVSTDPESRSMLLGGKVNNKASRKVVTKKGDRVVLSGEEFNALVSAADDYIQSCINRQYDLMEAIDAAVTVAQLEAINEKSGWPQ